MPDLASGPPPRRAAPPPQATRTSRLDDELRLLTAAQSALEPRPAAALRHLATHRQRYPRGALAAEREAYAIQALLRLDRRAEAERRYYDFVRAFPGNELRERLEAMLDAR
ncbi:MAG: hypothetical protein ACFCGT_14760 [Sandaracinaceae bacterium]